MESHRVFCKQTFVEQHTVQRQVKYLKNEIEQGKKLYMYASKHPIGIVSVHKNLIENLYVEPREQRKGFGSILLKFAIEQCEGALTLHVLSNNKKAYTFYIKHGFIETNQRIELADDLYEIEMIRRVYE